jgi:hypothetical protein
MITSKEDFKFIIKEFARSDRELICDLCGEPLTIDSSEYLDYYFYDNQRVKDVFISWHTQNGTDLVFHVNCAHNLGCHLISDSLKAKNYWHDRLGHVTQLYIDSTKRNLNKKTVKILNNEISEITKNIEEKERDI